jgi:hypothetical protein
VQAPWDAIAHAPVADSQHAPEGCGHGLGEHTPPSCHVVFPTQRDKTTCEHPPFAVLQQAPGTGHGLGEHAPPIVHAWLASLHEARATSVHAPVTKSQHVPGGCGHGFGEHTPEEIHVVAPVQCACVE